MDANGRDAQRIKRKIHQPKDGAKIKVPKATDRASNWGAKDSGSEDSDSEDSDSEDSDSEDCVTAATVVGVSLGVSPSNFGTVL
jgi:hypothetical protein